MISAELYKLRNQRTPWVLTAFATLAMAAPSVYFFFHQPGDAGEYAAAVAGIFGPVSLVIGSIMGGWLLGHEYNQSTLRRVALLEARRPVLLGIKLVAGGLVLLTSYLVSLATALGLAFVVAQSHGDSLVTTDVFSNLLSVGLVGLASAVMAFGISAITRSSAYSTLSVLAGMMIFSPLLTLIPRFGGYSPGLVINQTTDRIAGVASVDSVFTEYAITDGRALLAAVAWVGGILLLGQQVFARQDI